MAKIIDNIYVIVAVCALSGFLAGTFTGYVCANMVANAGAIRQAIYQTTPTPMPAPFGYGG